MKVRDVGQDILNSRKAFTQLVWPEISDEWFDGADIEPVEGAADTLKESMDIESGIDYWSVGDGLQSIASRVQNVGADISTFTVRVSRATGAKTELQKRLEEHDSDNLTPTWMIHAYIDAPENDNQKWEVEKGELLNVAKARQKELIKYVKNGSFGSHYEKNGTKHNDWVGENEEFYYVHWYTYNKFRDVEWLSEPKIQPFAPILTPSFDPANDTPHHNQNQLDGYGD